MQVGRLVAIAGFLVGLAALVLQISLTIPARMEQGHGLFDALLFYFTFFTILTNIMLVLVYASALWPVGWLAWWRQPATRGMTTAAITLVMAFYHLVLAATWNPQGWFAVADVLLHYVTPITFIGWWLVFQPKGSLRLADVPWMLVPPLVWLLWTMLRGAAVGEYPYPILEVQRLGYPQVLVNIAVMLVILSVLNAAVVGVDRLLGPKGKSPGAAPST